MRSVHVKSDCDGVVTDITLVVLSPCEIKLMKLLCRCYADKDIATELGIFPGTVRSVMSALRRDLEMHTRGELVRWASCHPDALDGAAVPKMIHAPGCSCGSAYCRAAQRLVA